MTPDEIHSRAAGLAETFCHWGTVVYLSSRYDIYCHEGYFGIALCGASDTLPYCAYSNIHSLLMAKGWSKRTPVKKNGWARAESVGRDNEMIIARVPHDR